MLWVILVIHSIPLVCNSPLDCAIVDMWINFLRLFSNSVSFCTYFVPFGSYPPVIHANVDEKGTYPRLYAHTYPQPGCCGVSQTGGSTLRKDIIRKKTGFFSHGVSI